eukprot:gene30011-18086_t
MGSTIKFTSLGDDDADTPLCYLLEIDGFTFLMDCGWTDSFDVERLEPVKRVIDSIDAVLISHPSILHIGALPYLVGKCGMKAPIYTTLPVRKMGEMLMYDLYLAKKAISDFDTYDLNDVDAAFAFAKWEQLRYFQHFELQGKGAGINITPFNAGRFVGGSIWKISKGGEDIVYAVDYCHRKERHLNEAAIMTPELFHRPALMITSAFTSLAPTVNGAKRDAAFLEVVLATLRGDGTVLIPIDTSGRVLELALFLDEFWARERMVYPLVLLSDMAPTVIDFSKQQLEWMSEQIGKAFESKRSNPFNFKFLKLINSMDQLAQLPQGPKVGRVGGFEGKRSKPFSFRFLKPNNSMDQLALFPEGPKIGTLADTIQRHVTGPQPLKLSLDESHRVPLKGEELASYKRQQALGKSMPPVNASPTCADDDDDDSDDDLVMANIPSPVGDTKQGLKRNSSGTPRVHRSSSLSIGAIGKGALKASKALSTISSLLPEVLLDGFKPPEGAAYPMFPDEDEPMVDEWDDYGVLIKPEDFSMLPYNAPLGGAGGAEGSVGGGGQGDSLQRSGVDAMQLDAPTTAEMLSQQGQGGGRQNGEAYPQSVGSSVSDRRAVASRFARQASVVPGARYFDFDARADGRITKKVLQDIAPRQLVLVQGSAETKLELETHCKRELADFQTKVIAMQDGARPPPALLQPELSSCLCLSDALNARAHMKQMKSYGLAHVDGAVGPPDPHLLLSQINVVMANYGLAHVDSAVGAPGPHQPNMMTLLPPREGAGAGEGIFIADSEDGIRLSDIKKALADAGMESIFKAGMLVCGPVTISKGRGDKAHLVVEGSLSAEFYKIRDAIYGGYSVC